MARYLNESDVYNLLGERGMATVHCSQIDVLPRADVAPRAEWISVEERLPDLYGTYLVYTYDNHIKLGYFCELVIGLPPSFDDYAVTHWMHLPEPPKNP